MSSDPYTGTLTVGTGSVTGQTTISTIQSDSNSTSSPSTVTITSPLLQVLQLSGANPSSNVMEVTENATIQGSLTVKTNATTKTLTTAMDSTGVDTTDAFLGMICFLFMMEKGNGGGFFIFLTLNENKLQIIIMF